MTRSPALPLTGYCPSGMLEYPKTTKVCEEMGHPVFVFHFWYNTHSSQSCDSKRFSDWLLYFSTADAETGTNIDEETKTDDNKTAAATTNFAPGPSSSSCFLQEASGTLT